MPRRIFFLTGTRAEYDLIVPVLAAVNASGDLRGEIVAVAAQLSPFHGHGLETIRADGFPLAGCVESLLSSESVQGRSLSFAQLVDGLTRLLAVNRPDMLFVVGDREEALAAALVGNFLGIHVVHHFGGDRCGATVIDEVFRPAISKLAHFHCTATEGHRERLIRMGEPPEHVWTTGGSGMDRLRTEPDIPPDELSARHGIDVTAPYFLLVHHPTAVSATQDPAEEMRQILQGILPLGHPVLCSYPNFDPGNIAIRSLIDRFRAEFSKLIVYHNLPRGDFVSLYRRAAAIVGNSSSIVLESGYLGVPGILVGTRQNLRETGANVLRVEAIAESVRAACYRAVHDEAFREQARRAGSLYGDGHASQRIVEVLRSANLTPQVLMKTMSY